MALKSYTYVVTGTAADGQTWEVAGSTTWPDFYGVWHEALQDVFLKLTKGEAVFGHPGVGCRGPYEIHKVVIEQRKN